MKSMPRAYEESLNGLKNLESLGVFNVFEVFEVFGGLIWILNVCWIWEP